MQEQDAVDANRIFSCAILINAVIRLMMNSSTAGIVELLYSDDKPPTFVIPWSLLLCGRQGPHTLDPSPSLSPFFVSDDGIL